MPAYMDTGQVLIFMDLLSEYGMLGVSADLENSVLLTYIPIASSLRSSLPHFE